MSRFRKERRAPSLHMAPLIDCVLLLLVFFMLTATYVNRGIPIDLPTSEGGEPLKRGLTITIKPDGEIFLGSKAVTLIELRASLFERAAEETEKITLRTDRNVPVGRVVQVIGLARELGSEISLVTEPSARREE